MTGTIRKRDVGRLYRHVRRRSSFGVHGQQRSFGNFKPPSLSQIRYALQRIHPRTVSFLTSAWNSINKFRVWLAKTMYRKLPRYMKKIVKKMGRIEASIHKTLVCIEPRLKRRYGKLISEGSPPCLGQQGRRQFGRYSNMELSENSIQNLLCEVFYPLVYLRRWSSSFDSVACCS